eukprot:g3144.t1
MHQAMVDFLIDKGGAGGSDGGAPEELDELASKVQGIIKKRGLGKRDITDVFLEFDRDDSGEVDEYEFEDAMKSLRIELRRGEARKLFKRFDANGDGRITYREFVDFARGGEGESRERKAELDELASKVQGIIKKRGLGKRDITDVFLEFDRDDSGEVDEYEFEDAMKSLRIELRRGEARKLFKRFDANGDGRITYREFVDFARGGGGSPRKGGRKVSSKRSSLESDLGRLGERLKRKARGLGRGAALDEFTRADRGDRGYLSPRDFERCLGRLGLDISSSERREVVDIVGDGNDRVRYGTFVDFLTGKSQSISLERRRNQSTAPSSASDSDDYESDL